MTLISLSANNFAVIPFLSISLLLNVPSYLLVPHDGLFSFKIATLQLYNLAILRVSAAPLK